MLNTFEDRFIAVGAKIEAVDACLATLINGYFGSCPGGISKEKSEEYRRAGTMAAIASDYLAQADRLFWELEDDVSEATQTTRIDVATSVVISGPAKQPRTAQKEVMTCAR